MWKKTIAMILALGLLTAYSFCLTSCKDNQEISDNQSGNDSENKTALSEATDFFNKYYDDLNAKKVDSIKSYYSMDDEKVQELCDNLNFMFMSIQSNSICTVLILPIHCFREKFIRLLSSCIPFHVNHDSNIYQLTYKMQDSLANPHFGAPVVPDPQILYLQQPSL